MTSLVTAGSPFDFVLGGTARGVAKYYDGSVESAPGSSRAATQTLTSSWWPGRRQRRRHTHAAPSTTPTTRLSTFHVTELRGLDIKSDGTIVAGSAVTLTALIRALESLRETTATRSWPATCLALPTCRCATWGLGGRPGARQAFPDVPL